MAVYAVERAGFILRIARPFGFMWMTTFIIAANHNC
jgi:hypothetical protein